MTAGGCTFGYTCNSPNVRQGRLTGDEAVGRGGGREARRKRSCPANVPAGAEGGGQARSARSRPPFALSRPAKRRDRGRALCLARAHPASLLRCRRPAAGGQRGSVRSVTRGMEGLGPNGAALGDGSSTRGSSTGSAGASFSPRVRGLSPRHCVGRSRATQGQCSRVKMCWSSRPMVDKEHWDNHLFRSGFVPRAALSPTGLRSAPAILKLDGMGLPIAVAAIDRLRR